MTRAKFRAAVMMTIQGVCRIYDCDKPIAALIIHKSPDDQINLTMECREHAKYWEDVENVVILWAEEVQLRSSES